MVRKRIRKENANPNRKQISFELKQEEKTTKKNKAVVFVLIAIILLTLTMNCYFNYTSGTGINQNGKTLGEKYYLGGPDPYYHARITEFIYYNGYVPFWQANDYDPLLDYPMIRQNPRPPLFDLSMAVVAHGLSPFMSDVDALGHSLQIMPAIYGALLVIPVYLIGALLFNKKTALIGAFFVAIIPIHLGSGHGSAYGLADHDSFILLLTTTGLFFFLKALKSLNDKYDNVKQMFAINKQAICYAILTGVIYATVALSWEGFKLVVVLLAFYCIIQLFINCYQKKEFLTVTIMGSVALLTTSLIISPYYYGRGTFNDVEIVLSLVAIILIMGTVFHLQRDKIPYILTIPILAGLGATAMYVVNIYQLAPFYYYVQMFFSGSVYVGKISLTIAEAGGTDISGAVMGFGPALYWVAWFGAIIFMARTLLHKKKEMIFMTIWFVMTFYFTTTAGRFLNDFVPFIAIFAGWTIVFIMDKINYKQLFVAIKSATGFNKLKAIKISHLFGIVFIAFIVIMPNVVLAFDAATPWSEKQKYMDAGVPMGAYGISFGKEQYWSDAFAWLNDQDTNILNDSEKPAIISWWDYGFYEVMIGHHPTVADNFQDGVETAANFKTATSEKEAISVLIARLIDGNYIRTNNKKEVSENVKQVIIKYLGENKTDEIIKRIYDNNNNPPYKITEIKYIISEYEPELSNTQKINNYNQYYRRFADITSDLTDEEMTNFYMEIQKTTGFEIRYYGTEHYDNSIFTVFTFLADKSLIPIGGMEDDYMYAYFTKTDRETNEQTILPHSEIKNITNADRDKYDFMGPYFNKKPLFFETMFYKTFFGTPTTDGSIPENRIPTYGLKHWVPMYISPYVVIAKYYEGYKLNGTVTCDGLPTPGIVVVVLDEHGIPHDMTMVTEKEYNVVLPAGNLTVATYFNNKELSAQNITVTEEQATRKTKYHNTIINLTVPTVSLNGTITKNQTAMPNIAVNLFGEYTGMFTTIKTNETGYYEFKDLVPSYYKIRLYENDTEFHNETIIVSENIVKNIEV
jgi:dolichyl-diphosphooligosaccharide--protein glycosyltransferase